VSLQKTLPLAGLLAFSLLWPSLIAAQPHLVKDIDFLPSPVSSVPGGLATIGNVTYFFANDPATGNELWKTDGTTAGTVLVRDIYPGPESGIPNDAVAASVVGNRMLFVADDGVHGQEVWSTDGTSNGTVMLADAAPGAASSNPVLGPVTGSAAYFTAYTPAGKLFRTDGTFGGTHVVQDLKPGAIGSAMLGAFGPSLVYYTLFEGSIVTLYMTDGTVEGTKALGPFAGRSGISVGTSFLFAVSAGSGKWDLMKTDGSPSGTGVVRSAFSGTQPASFTVAKGVAYFVADDGISGSEVWACDGSAAGTHLLADLNPGAASLNVRQISVIGDRLLIMTGPANGQLWSSDGTAAGTTLVKSIPGATAGIVSGANLYFGWNDGVHGSELWKSDGSAEGTKLVTDIAAGSKDSIFTAFFVSRPDGVFLPAADLSHGLEPWISDGTPAGTRMLKNIATDDTQGSYPTGFASLGGKLFFIASDGVTSSVWTTDGTESGTLPLSASTAGGSRPYGTGIVSGGLYYYPAASPPILVPGTGFPMLELWRTDGTGAGTFRLMQQPNYGNLDALIPFKGGLVFGRMDSAHGYEPWFTDGTIAGTRWIVDSSPGEWNTINFLADAAVAGDHVYFSGTSSGRADQQPWRTDGTAVGTQELSAPDRGDSQSPYYFTSVGDSVFYIAHNSELSHGSNLMKANTSSGESVLVHRFVNTGSPNSMWNVGGTLLFTINQELWRSDGTDAGTKKVSDLDRDPSCGGSRDPIVVDGVLFWFGEDTIYRLGIPERSPELWRSDGTTAGTFRLATFEDPYEGAVADSIRACSHPLLYHNGHIYFTGDDPIHGAELWVTDGTAAGTHLLYDINPGVASSDPGQYMIVGGTLFFTATAANSGRELWAMCVDDCPGGRRRAAGK